MIIYATFSYLYSIKLTAFLTSSEISSATTKMNTKPSLSSIKSSSEQNYMLYKTIYDLKQRRCVHVLSKAISYTSHHQLAWKKYQECEESIPLKKHKKLITKPIITAKAHSLVASKWNSCGPGKVSGLNQHIFLDQNCPAGNLRE